MTTTYASSQLEMKRDYVLNELRSLGVTYTQEGVDIRTLDYDRLKEELVLASFRKRDIENENEGWF